MIHLKRFNEAVTDWDLNLIRRFCYENLAYLLDGPADIDFSLSLKDAKAGFSDINNVGYYKVMIKDINSKWSDIEADICPFLELLEEKYNLFNITTNNQIEFKFKTFNSKGRLWFSINEILAGCMEENLEISAMRFVIEL
jgi:hypothetical protein